MATAKSAPLSMVAQSPEEESLVKEYKAAQNYLRGALTQRQQMFDPVLLAMAQGFLAPTKTGSFGESISNVAGRVLPVQEEQQKQDIQMAQMRAELAAQDLQMAQQAETEKYLRNRPSLFGGAQPAAPAAPTAAPTGAGQPAAPAAAGQVAPSGAAPAAPQAQAIASATGAAPSSPILSGNDALAALERELTSRDPRIREAAKGSIELLKMRSGAIKVQDRVVVDTSDIGPDGRPRVIADLGDQKPQEIIYKGQPMLILMTALERQQYQDAMAKGPAAADAYFDVYLKGRRPQEIPGQEQKEFETPYGKFAMTPNEYAQFSLARSQGKGKQWIDAWRRGEAVTETKAEPSAPGEAVGRRTVGQAAAESAQQKSYAESTGTEMAKATRERIALGDDALSRRQTAESIMTLVGKEGMDQVTAVLERPGAAYAFLKAIEDGLNLGRGYGLSVPQVRDIFTANKIVLPKIPGESKSQYDERVMGVISNLQQVSSLFAQSLFGLRSLAKGQGAISNLENKFFENVAPSVRDTIQTLLAKTLHAKARADFDQKVADILLNEKKSWDELRSEKRYKEMIADYDKQLLSIYSAGPGKLRSSVPAAAESAPSAYSDAAADLRRKLNR